MKDFRYVDLGLPSGTLWANQNLPGYYAFGELEEKPSYTQDNSETFDKSKNQLYTEGICDAKGNYISKHTYTIPTKEQFLELMTECTWTWDSDKLGYEVSNTVNGEKVSIFLPTEGYKLKTDTVDKGIWGNYWTSTIIDGKYYGVYLYFFKNAIYWGNHSERFYGRSVRPVLNKDYNSLIDLNLPSKTLWDTINYGAKSMFETGQIIAYGEGWGKDPELYDIDHWYFSIKDEGTWKYRLADTSSTKSMWDNVENYKGVKAKCLKVIDGVYTFDWAYNNTGLLEPTKEDYEELIKNIEKIETIKYNNTDFKLIYFKNSYEVLVFSFGRRIKDYPEPGQTMKTIPQYYYWTKTLQQEPNVNVLRSAYVFHIEYENALIELSNGEHSKQGLVQGMQIRRIKKQ